MSRTFVLFLLVSCASAGFWGCGGAGPGPSGPSDGSDGGSGDGSGGGDGGNDTATIPAVSLSASNTTPQVGEQVTLFCDLASGGDGNVVFAFQPQSSRLQVDESTGRATFVVSDSDVGAAARFTCTATNATGTSAASNAVVITATAPP